MHDGAHERARAKRQTEILELASGGEVHGAVEKQIDHENHDHGERERRRQMREYVSEFHRRSLLCNVQDIRHVPAAAGGHVHGRIAVPDHNGGFPAVEVVGERAAETFKEPGKLCKFIPARAALPAAVHDHKAVVSRLIVPERRARVQSGDVRVEFLDALGDG